jgi:hypothetical protein
MVARSTQVGLGGFSQIFGYYKKHERKKKIIFGPLTRAMYFYKAILKDCLQYMYIMIGDF